MKELTALAGLLHTSPDAARVAGVRAGLAACVVPSALRVCGSALSAAPPVAVSGASAAARAWDPLATPQLLLLLAGVLLLLAGVLLLLAGVVLLLAGVLLLLAGVLLLLAGVLLFAPADGCASASPSPRGAGTDNAPAACLPVDPTASAVEVVCSGAGVAPASSLFGCRRAGCLLSPAIALVLLLLLAMTTLPLPASLRVIGPIGPPPAGPAPAPAAAAVILLCTAHCLLTSRTKSSAVSASVDCTSTGTSCSSRCAQLALQEAVTSAAAVAAAAGGTSAGSSEPHAAAAARHAWSAAACMADSSASGRAAASCVLYRACTARAQSCTAQSETGVCSQNRFGTVSKH
jgi:hypothetical protein